MRYQISKILQFTFCFIIITFAMTLSILCNRNFIEADKKIVEFNDNNINCLYLGLHDVYGMENQKSLGDFFNEKNSLDRLKTFNSYIHKAFNYLEFDKQNLLILDNIDYKDEFRIDYGEEIYGINDEFGVSLKSYQIGSNTYNNTYMPNSIEFGRGFNKEDFIANKPDQSINAILGYEYIGFFDIGDNVNFEYISKKINLRIIGFFKKNTSFIFNNEVINLDKHILFPLVETNYLPTNPKEEYYQKILYSQKNWGFIKVNNGENILEYKKIVNNYNKELDLQYEINEAYIFDHIKNISNTMNSTKGIFLILSWVFFFVASLIFLIICIFRFKQNIRDYSIHLISGSNLKKIKIKVFLVIIGQFFTSLAASYMINLFLFKENSIYKNDNQLLKKSFNQTAIVSIVVLAIILIILNNFINKNNVNISTRKDF